MVTEIKQKIALRDKANSVLSNVVALHGNMYPQLRYIQNLWATRIVDMEDRFSEEPYDTIKRILPRIMDLINVEFKDDMVNRIYRSNIFDGLEGLGLACKTEDFKLKLL